MEEIFNLIFHGFKLAKDLESSLPNLANQPHSLSKSCSEIIRVFSNARDRLDAHQETSSFGYMGFQKMHRGSTSFNVHGLPESERSGAGSEVAGRGLGGIDMEGSSQLSGGGGDVQPMIVSGLGRGLSSQRTRRRKDDANNETVRVPAPRMGNIEIPPEDGYTWRKYGQKEILGARFPRSYYRCTHQKLYKCQAKKQVQRLDNDPYTFEVTYRGRHTCHMSSTAPSLIPPPPPSTQITQNITPPPTTTQPPPPPFQIGRWLSMDINRSTAGNTSIFSSDPTMTYMYRDFGLNAGGGRITSTSTTASTTDGAGPSTIRYGRDTDYQLMVADWADVMFNSGSTSSNSMDLIFSSMELEKWEGGEKKK